jgi:copper resistance protein B
MKGALLLLALLTAAGIARAQEDRFPLPPKQWPSPVPDQEPFAYFLLDRLEYRAQKGADALYWDAQAWFGGDYNRLWLKSEGQRIAGAGTQDADLQVLYARRIAPFWHVQGGLRTEARPEPTKNYGVLALQGIAPYWFTVETTAFFRSGEISGRLEAEYDQLLTQRLILQPRIDSDFSTKADPERGVGRGINDVVLGLRLRYEIRREFAPYVGVTWSRKVGDTADIARGRGEDVRATALVLGLRVWY